MTPHDVERVRVRIADSWRPNLRCADCLGPPTCPSLRDALWLDVWQRTPPRGAAPPRCNCEDWTRLGERLRPGPKVTHTDGRQHWFRCDLLSSASRRQLLCLECAERRLNRPIVVEDLMPCLANYYVAVVDRRAAIPDDAREGLQELALRSSTTTPNGLAARQWLIDHGVIVDG